MRCESRDFVLLRYDGISRSSICGVVANFNSIHICANDHKHIIFSSRVLQYIVEIEPFYKFIH